MEKLKTILLIGFFSVLNFHEVACSQGFQAGYFFQPQFSSISNNKTEQYVNINSNQTINLFTGLTASYFITDRFGLGTGICYGHDAQKFIYEKSGFNIPTERSAHHYIFNLIKVPILVKYLSKVGKVRLILDGGPHFCYLVKTTNKSSYGKFDYTDDYSKLQVGFQIGTGVGVQVKEKFMVFLKPNIDFTNLSFHYTLENVDKEYPLGNNVTSSSIGLQAGIAWSK